MEPSCPRDCPREVLALIQACSQKEPQARPSATEVYKHLAACSNEPPELYAPATPRGWTSHIQVLCHS